MASEQAATQIEDKDFNTPFPSPSAQEIHVEHEGPAEFVFKDIDADRIDKAMKALDVFATVVNKLMKEIGYPRPEAINAAYGLVAATTDFDLRKAMQPLTKIQIIPPTATKGSDKKLTPNIKEVSRGVESALGDTADATPSAEEPKKPVCDQGVRPSEFLSAHELMQEMQCMLMKAMTVEEAKKYAWLFRHFNSQCFYTFLCDKSATPPHAADGTHSGGRAVDLPESMSGALPPVSIPDMIHYRSAKQGRGDKSAGYVCVGVKFPNTDIAYSSNGYWWFGGTFLSMQLLTHFVRFLYRRRALRQSGNKDVKMNRPVYGYQEYPSLHEAVGARITALHVHGITEQSDMKKVQSAGA